MGLSNEEEQSLPQAIEERSSLFVLPSKCEEAGFAKDRDRQRAPVGQTRPTLGAVGRVASRVRTSGISRISTLLPRIKEGDEEVNSSPWGVGTAATISRSQSASVLPNVTNTTEVLTSKVSPKPKRNSDVLDMLSSPVSTDGTEPTKTPNQTEDRSRGAVAGNLNLLDRQASNAQVKCKFSFRPSASIDSKPPESSTGEGKIVEKLISGVRFNIPKEEGESVKGIDDKDISVSAPVITFQEENNISAPKVAFVSESTNTLEANPALGPVPDMEKMEKSRILKFTFGRSKSRAEDPKRKSKSEKPRGKIELSRSRSQASRNTSPRAEKLENESKSTSLSRRRSVGNGTKTGGWFSKQNSVGGTKGKKSVWFGFLGGDNSDRAGKQVAPPKERTKTKVYSRRSSIGPDFFAKAAAKNDTDLLSASRIDLLPGKRGEVPNSAKSFEQVDVVAAEEFVLDMAGGDEDDEEIANETPIRSLAVDDFITYQTGRGKKGTKGR